MPLLNIFGTIVPTRKQIGTGRTGRIVFGCGSATYTQTGFVVTVTKTAHGLISSYNGYDINLVVSTGTLLTGWLTNFTYVDANTFTCTASISQTTSGALGANTTRVIVTSDIIPANALGAKNLIEMQVSFANNNTIDMKLAEVYTAWLYAQTTNTYYVARAGFANIAQSKQLSISPSYTAGYGPSTQALNTFLGTVDTTVDQTVSIGITLANSADWMALCFYDTELKIRT